ncbi:MAG: cytochrome B [Bacteroidetes bacterium]|nr:MAG: cytochrome B [Bacteroidota bacterium]
MLTGLLHTHSLLRYILLAFILISIFKSFSGWVGKKPYLPGDKKVALFTLIAAHLQLVIGLILYFGNNWHSNIGAAMKDSGLRFWSVEHMAMMLIAIALITVGYSAAKRGKDDEAKHKKIAIFFLLALIIIFLAIPWPFPLWSSVTRGWMPGM